ncbi:HlyD family secretion protein [Tengunoibacter tsumagoiensis]|uniref:Multidrug efflux protein n=1 Tax=Tengunoibacter tsumagoiensis TaxID=2014871 RepID=A0A401ZWJ6_9CHLR|nr:efflux RND transporter periplasmic adaptor subunit [Tengunoibacter tsumagoiensis]GCE11182.1 multidrug efflux protein [Tengunoibacter tsumagoiensis]
MRRMILITVLVVVAFLAILGGAGYWFYNSYSFYTTDDAKIDGQIVSVTSPQNGQLKTLAVKLGDTVTAGQVIGTIVGATPAPVEVTSPIAGTIVQVSGIVGTSVSPAASIVQIANLDNIHVMAYIDENKINDIKTGQDVDIHVDAYSGTTYSGHVQQIVQVTAGSFALLPSSDNASGNFTKVGQRIPVVITLDGGRGGNAVMPGMSAEVTIHLH